MYRNTIICFYLGSLLNKSKVSISAHPTMACTPRNAKKAKISVYKPEGKKQKAGSGSIVVLTPFKTRRGKTIYTKVDAAPYYAPFNEKDEPPKERPSKTPFHSKTTTPALLDDTFQWEASYLDDQKPHVPRIIKVRLSCDMQFRSNKK